MKTTKKTIRNSIHKSFAPRSLGEFCLPALILLLLLAMWPAGVIAQNPVAPASGSGAEGDPYVIANLDNLAWIMSSSTRWDKHYIQTADIDASETQNWDGGEGFTPIGDPFTPFIGNYNGQGHTISGLFMDRSNSSLGLFDQIGVDGTIENLGLTNVNITGTATTGGLVAFNSEGTIDNCYTTGSVSGGDPTGGLVGWNSDEVINSYSTSSVNGSDRTGGLVGRNTGLVLTSYSTGSVTGPSAGGLIAGIGGGAIDSYWNTETSGQATSNDGTPLTTAQMRQQSNFSGFDFTDVWSIVEGASYPYLQNNTQSPSPGVNPPETGDGTSGNPYQITGLHDLYWLSQTSSEWDADFIQTADIDASATSGWDGGAGFTPIGKFPENFTGQYDGDGHTISGLTIKRGSTSNISLFGRVEGGTIKNLGVTNVDITGDVNTGGLVGFQRAGSIINHCYSTGNIEGTTKTGGLLGLQTANAEVSNSYSTASVSGDDIIGGLVGSIHTSTVSNSYSTGSVNGTTGTGGLLGENQTDAVITSSYWNIETSGQTTSASSGTGLTTAEMKLQASFAGFDFGSTWSIDQEQSYPYLQDNIPSPLPGLGDEITVEHNQSLLFDGTDDWVEVSPGSDLDGLTALTVEAWIRPSSVGARQGIVEKHTSPDQGWWFNLEASGRVRLLVVTAAGNNRFAETPVISLTDAWYHVVGVYDGTDVTVYLNGSDVTSGLSGTGNGPIVNSSNTLSIGQARWTVSSFDGLIDEVRIWNDVRTTDEIRNNMFQSLGGDEANLAGYWRLQEAAGSTILDLSVNDNHGSLTNATTWSADTHPYGTLITGDEGWRMMTSPVGGASYGDLLGDLWTQGFTGADVAAGTSNVLVWNESAGDWASIGNATEVPGAGTGFIVYVYADEDPDAPDTQGGFPKTILVDNTQNDGSIAPTLTFTSAGVPEGDGWNLVGNPYGATIDWDAAGWTKTNLNAPVYVWSDSAGGAGAYLSSSEGAGTLPGGLIALFQGFWVQASGAAPVLEMTDDIRSAGGVFYKEAPVPQIRFRLEGSQLHSNAILMLHEQAEAGKDPLDAWKLQSLNQQYLSLYTTTPEGHALDINALPQKIEQPLELMLNFEGSNLGGRYTLSWNPKDLPETWAQGAVTLTDLHTDRIIDLSRAGKYVFEVDGDKEKPSKEPLEGYPTHGPIPTVLKAKSKNPRFLLTINPAGSGHELAGILESIELKQNYPNPFNPETVIRYGVPEQARVQLNVYDILGRRVATLLDEQRPAGRYQASFNANRLASGLYFYRLRVGGSVLTKKMMLIK